MFLNFLMESVSHIKEKQGGMQLQVCLYLSMIAQCITR